MTKFFNAPITMAIIGGVIPKEEGVCDHSHGNSRIFCSLFPKIRSISMVDVDTFLTALYVIVDDFCKTSLPGETHPGPYAALTRSEVVTLAIFGQ